MTLDWLEKPTDNQSQLGRRPPHARLPDEFDEELPVHGVNERSLLVYLDKVKVKNTFSRAP